MRVAKKELVYALTRNPLASLVTLHLECQKIENLAQSLSECYNLITLRLNRNALKSLGSSLESCASLYSLHLASNRLENLDGVVEYRAWGCLDLSNNNLSMEELGRLKEVHVVELYTFGNSGIPNSASNDLREVIAYRRAVLGRVPRAWVIDGHFVSSFEREGVKAVGGGEEAGGAVSDAPCQAGKKPSNKSPAHHFLINIAANAPTKNQEKLDLFRLKVILAHYDGNADRHNAAVFSQVHKPKPPMLPNTHVVKLVRLGFRDRLSLAVLLATNVQYDVPRVVLKGALVVLLSGSLTEKVIDDIACLPPFVCTALVTLLRGIAMEEIVPDLSEGKSGAAAAVSAGKEYTVVDKELLNSIPEVATRHRILARETDRYKDGEAIRCRHAVRLLQRSPYCPLLTAGKQATADLQKIYDSMEPLFNAAGFGKDDLSLGLCDVNAMEFKVGRDEPNRPYRRFWSEASEASVGGEASGASVEEEPREKGEGERVGE